MLANGGADLSRVIMGHLDRTVFEFDALLSIAESGCYLEWDLFGNEGSYYPLAEIDMPSDAQRLGFIKRIADAGYSDKIVIGQDICTKHRLTKYGGHGYGHILENIVPKMRRKGFSEELIHAITVGNRLAFSRSSRSAYRHSNQSITSSGASSLVRRAAPMRNCDRSRSPLPPRAACPQSSVRVRRILCRQSPYHRAAERKAPHRRRDRPHRLGMNSSSTPPLHRAPAQPRGSRHTKTYLGMPKRVSQPLHPQKLRYDARMNL